MVTAELRIKKFLKLKTLFLSCLLQCGVYFYCHLFRNWPITLNRDSSEVKQTYST